MFWTTLCGGWWAVGCVTTHGGIGSVVVVRANTLVAVETSVSEFSEGMRCRPSRIHSFVGQGSSHKLGV
eukprot:5177704-Amphidinium_carterae.1